MFERRSGFFRETANPHVNEKVDEKGNVLGFSVMKVSALKVRVGTAKAALDRFEATWKKPRGEKVAAEHVLTFANLQLLLRTLTPARWTLLERLRAEGPLSVNQLARRLRRDYKYVHGDVKRLAELGLIERR